MNSHAAAFSFWRALMLCASLVGVRSVAGTELPKADLDFLQRMTRDVIAASRVHTGSNGGGDWPLTNSAGFDLVTPGKDTYRAFWIRDFSMSVDSELIQAPELLNHLFLICRAQNGAEERRLAHQLHLPPWSIPDHINYDGRPVFFPGTYASGDDQGNGTFGRLPPADDHYEFIHIAYAYWRMTADTAPFTKTIGNVTVFERLRRAFLVPTCDAWTGLVETTEDDRAVGFGFCDAEVHTGKLLFASLLRYRAAGELAELAQKLGDQELPKELKKIQKCIRVNIPRVFHDRGKKGWLLASTGLSGQPDVWGTLYALHLGVLHGSSAATARQTIAEAIRTDTITCEGGVRHVPTNFDFSTNSAWQRSVSSIGTYQNGGYWHTASGWLIEALWTRNPVQAQQVFTELMSHLRNQDFRKGPGFGAPWEVFGRNGAARQNAVYLASVALPYSILKKL